MPITIVAEALQMSRANATRLVADGWIRPELHEVAMLADRGTVTAVDGAVPVVRLGSPRENTEYDENGNVVTRWIGAAPPEGHGLNGRDDVVRFSKLQIVDAARKWWTGPADRVEQAGVLLVATGGWVVAVLAINAIDDEFVEGTVRRASFDATLIGRISNLSDRAITDMDESHPAAGLARQALGMRVPPIQGAPLVILEPRTRSGLQEATA